MLSGHDHWPYLGRKQILTSSLRSRGGHLRATRASAPLQLPTGEGRDEQLRVGTAVAMLCVLSHSVVSDSATVWTAARQAPLSMGILQARVLEWVAMPSSRGSSPPEGSNLGRPHCQWILYRLSHRGSPRILEWVACPFSRGPS